MDGIRACCCKAAKLTTNQLQSSSTAGVKISMGTIKYTGGHGNGDMVDGVKIDLSEIREYVSSFIKQSVTLIEAEYKSKITEWEIKVKVKDTELTEATTKIKNLSLQIQKYKCEIKFLEEENTQIRKTEEFKEHQYEKHLKEREEEIERHIKEYSRLYSESVEMHAEILMYKKLLEIMGSRIHICGKDQPIFTSAGCEVMVDPQRTCEGRPLLQKCDLSVMTQSGSEEGKLDEEENKMKHPHKKKKH